MYYVGVTTGNRIIDSLIIALLFAIVVGLKLRLINYIAKLNMPYLSKESSMKYAPEIVLFTSAFLLLLVVDYSF